MTNIPTSWLFGTYVALYIIHKFKFHVGKTQTYLLGGIIIMLKKVMIICIAFSFVFIGGIAFALGDGPEAIKQGQEISPESAPISGDITPPDVPAELTTDDPKTTEGDELKERQQQEEAGAGEGDDKK